MYLEITQLVSSVNRSSYYLPSGVTVIDYIIHTKIIERFSQLQRGVLDGSPAAIGLLMILMTSPVIVVPNAATIPP